MLTQRVRGQAFQFRFKLLKSKLCQQRLAEAVNELVSIWGSPYIEPRGVIPYLNCLYRESPPGGPPERGREICHFSLKMA